jgi:TPR repeat protein
MYFNGIGVSKNDKEAVKWYKKAVEQGHVKAQINLALIYNKDEAKAMGREGFGFISMDDFLKRK